MASSICNVWISASSSARILEGFVRSPPVAVGNPVGLEQLDGIQDEPAESSRTYLPKRGGNHGHGDQNDAGKPIGNTCFKFARRV